MFKRIFYWRTYRAINRAAETHDWQTALALARRINDRDLIKAFALARITQLLQEI
jgi:hypothetical protein